MYNKSILVIALIVLLLNFSFHANLGGFENFIKTIDGKLYDGKKEFRFISFNIPNLLLIEDNMAIDKHNAWRLPNLYEIKDALLTIKYMGGNVVRTYAITVKRCEDLPGTPKHVIAPRSFNEKAFLTFDTLLAIANEVGIRLIVPLVDNWKWMGGKDDYVRFRGKGGHDFWSNLVIKEDFKKTVYFVLNRKNTVTGLCYKDDKAILAWELGNELWNAPIEWIEEMASFIKSIDTNHLINDGRQSYFVREDVLNSLYIDILSTHHYESDPRDMIDHIKKNTEYINYKKPYYIGEFGFLSTSALDMLMNTIIKDKRVSGALLWSLKFHNRDGGFYWHSEPSGRGLYKSYHYPGFQSGLLYDEINIMRIFTYYVELVYSAENYINFPPEKPKLLYFDHPAFIRWQGSAGANYYVLERKESGEKNWKVIEFAIDDATIPYYPQYADETVELGHSYYYRLKAVNKWGESDYSNVVGPIKVESKFLIDDCINFGKVFYKSKGVSIVTDDARRYKEDFHRYNLKKGEWIVYGVNGKIKNVKVIAFTEELEKNFISLTISKDGKNYVNTPFQFTDYFAGGQDYNYCVPYVISAALKGDFKFLRIRSKKGCQIGRVEIEYK